METEIIKNDSILDIVTIGNPILKEISTAIEDINKVKETCIEMIDTLRFLKGAGLAAPQIGKTIRLFIVEVRKTELFPDRPESPLYVVINPEIIKTSEEKEYGWESCLSIPGYVGFVPRYKSIKLKYFTIEGEQKEQIFDGYLARVMQHEYDHLEGINYMERIESLKDISTTENWKKYILNK
ncbi:MAG: peptide deformylase [Ignavibacteriales bacterium]